MKSSIVTGPLAFLQCAMLLLKGGYCLAGHELSWGIVLWPLWVLFFIAFVFWFLFGMLMSKLR